MKKPFKETKAGQLLLGAVQTIFPIAGDFIENVKSKDGGQGNLETMKALQMIVRYIVFTVALYMLFKGEIGFSEFKETIPVTN